MNYAIILAAGQGQRMNGKKDKLFLKAGGHPVVYYSIMSFNDHPEIDEIIVVGNKINKKELQELVKFYRFPKVKKVIIGGATRQQSFEKGFKEIAKKAKKDDIILVHNGANPLPSFKEILNTIKESEEHGACIVGRLAKSTIKELKGKKVAKTHDRKKIFEAETPQAAKFQIFKKALAHLQKNKVETTDEAMILEAIDQKIVTTEAHENNFKITTQADYLRLQTILGDLPADFRVGLGQDSHVFEEEKKGLVLGGLELKDELKLEANSDGDVILHAIFNALSQSIGDMSLGFYADSECEKGEKNSAKYLEIILKKVKKQKFKINNLGLMIEAKKPKIDPLVPKMRKSLATLLDIDTRRVGITATTGETCSVFGQGLGIQCFAIVSLIKEK
jgi:2-C-methyl-D-erythritol 4-phosphate cytidylyltransferase / 2-C-methyl-D-erythritol 2,4-cyclodiphosphate synthase